MNDKMLWDCCETYNKLLHYIRYKKCKLSEKIFGRSYWGNPKMVAGVPLKSVIKTNQIIYEKIVNGEAFWTGRFGGTEMNLIYQTLAHRKNPNVDRRADAVQRLCLLSGFFPFSIELGEKFTDLMLKDCQEIDLLGAWRRYMEEYIFLKYQKNTTLTELHRLEPWNMYQYPKSRIKPWTAALKGKRVLVIHPFTESIQKQYHEKRELLFANVFEADDILPEFELLTLKAVQTLGGEQDTRFQTWFDALQWMIDECKKIDFDVAIIGCGAYGFPLAAEIKRMGKTAIHLGGVTQILFGIIGTRWETEYPEFYKTFVNEYWVRPLEQEKITNANAIESGCYW